ncbi:MULTISPECIES: type II toxin-antitoxin system RatA family toxin [Sphingopyxis]|uniref:Cyclase n=1 Tax=Sphingopyxis granuli TaxID=267128 RepID=A0AA86GLZ7_9SPHN|nr:MULTISPECIES: type II toxin-antitoxin system RatA family toxin [Sphingopyxis]AMG74570.1 Cyclase [Sphingopyxis granuli]APW72724.1 ubiquinone-binding protein [Sphingopyxis granuli]AVA13774.1 ubiquinone-binding protein [Sphingopyxis sp. MG]ODU29151.1 MAG: ubiquinone-binding protein [Sphingopyxis sp. SCN 67-31]QUM71178.1 type II toxin-antitoxin system RatA family toxin [Sphingopyxis granuli]
MPRHHETRELPYSAEQMFALVTDIARYPEFLPWVVALRVRSQDEHAALADMIVGFKGLRESFSCRVEKHRPTHVAVHYIDGPMRHLDNEWHFAPLDGGGCRVDFLVDFSFRNRVFETLAGQMFDKALRRMIAAFEDRAAVLYGAGSSMSSDDGRSESFSG